MLIIFLSSEKVVGVQKKKTFLKVFANPLRLSYLGQEGEKPNVVLKHLVIAGGVRHSPTILTSFRGHGTLRLALD